MTSYYDILGIPKNASAKDVRQAFRKQARKYHPDLNAGDDKSAEKFKRINEAYEVLSDEKTREKYDRYGDSWKQADRIEAQHGRGTGDHSSWTYRYGGVGEDEPSGLFGGLDDLLGRAGSRFGRRRPAAGPTRIEAPVTVTLEEAFSGAKRHVTVTIGGKERRIEVTIPQGVDSGSVVRFSLDKGNELLLNVSVSPHDQFQRTGDDLQTDVAIPLEDAVLGSETEVDTLNGKVSLKVPPESQNGQRVRLTGLGMPRLGAPDARGNLYVILRPNLPTDLSKEERKLFAKLKELRSQQR